MWKYLVVWCGCFSFCIADGPIVRNGQCPEVCYAPIGLGSIIGKYCEWKNSGEALSPYDCDEEQVSYIDPNTLLWREQYYEPNSSILRYINFNVTGGTGLFICTELETLEEYDCVTLIFEDGLFLLYCCHNLSNNKFSDALYVYTSECRPLTHEDSCKIDSTLVRNNVEYNWVETRQTNCQRPDFPLCHR